VSGPEADLPEAWLMQQEKRLVVYEVCVNGYDYRITNDGSNRYRWRIAIPGSAEMYARTLDEAFVLIGQEVPRPTPQEHL
jgi:hypothetical protein